MLNKLYKQLKLFYIAKKEHKQRLQQPLYELNFNRTVEQIKENHGIYDDFCFNPFFEYWDFI